MNSRFQQSIWVEIFVIFVEFFIDLELLGSINLFWRMAEKYFLKNSILYRKHKFSLDKMIFNQVK